MASSPGRSWRSTAAEVSSSRRVSLTLRHPHAAHPPSSVRVSRADPGAPTALFIGCSFTQGWAISDQETFPWGVQEHFPAARVLNAGTAGYGTPINPVGTQRAFAQGEHPAVVVYGLIDNHEMRHVADPVWLYLGRCSQKEDWSAFPTPPSTTRGDSFATRRRHTVPEGRRAGRRAGQPAGRGEGLGAGRSLQVVRAEAYSDHPCDSNTHRSQAKREHWLDGGVGDVSAELTCAALTATAMASARPAATIRRLVAFSLVLIVVSLHSSLHQHPEFGWVHRLHVRACIAFKSSAGALWGRERLARSWGTER